MSTTETIEGIDLDRRRLLGAVTMGIAVAGAASLSAEHFAAAADENTILHPTRRETVVNVTYNKQLTALLVVDPYNDFISVGGKIWDRIRVVAEANDCVPHMLQVLNAARKAKLRIFYAMHHRYRPGDYETWRYIAPIQKAAWKTKSFEYGTWGGEIRPEFEPKPGEIVATEHWCSSGFANTDLDLELKKHGIHQLIVIGLIAHTCIEATVRFAAELGYEVTVVKDATGCHCAILLPTFACKLEADTWDDVIAIAAAAHPLAFPSARGGAERRPSVGHVKKKFFRLIADEIHEKAHCAKGGYLDQSHSP